MKIWLNLPCPSICIHSSGFSVLRPAQRPTLLLTLAFAFAAPSAAFALATAALTAALLAAALLATREHAFQSFFKFGGVQSFIAVFVIPFDQLGRDLSGIGAAAALILSTLAATALILSAFAASTLTAFSLAAARTILLAERDGRHRGQGYRGCSGQL